MGEKTEMGERKVIKRKEGGTYIERLDEEKGETRTLSSFKVVEIHEFCASLFWLVDLA